MLYREQSHAELVAEALCQKLRVDHYVNRAPNGFKVSTKINRGDVVKEFKYEKPVEKAVKKTSSTAKKSASRASAADKPDSNEAVS